MLILKGNQRRERIPQRQGTRIRELQIGREGLHGPTDTERVCLLVGFVLLVLGLLVVGVIGVGEDFWTWALCGGCGLELLACKQV